MGNTQLITTQQAAEMLCMQPSTLDKWRHRGIGPSYVKLARTLVRYRLVDIESFITQQLSETPLIEA